MVFIGHLLEIETNLIYPSPQKKTNSNHSQLIWGIKRLCSFKNNIYILMLSNVELLVEYLNGKVKVISLISIKH